jgi:hypothetical protein
MRAFFHWFLMNGNLFALLVTVGVAVFLGCCLECTNCSRSKNDELFRRRRN